MLNDTRRLASVDTIAHIHPIRDADAIECGVIRNWPVVIGKGEFHDGDQVLYIEPDAALPISDPRFASLAARGKKVIDGQEYHVLKTVRLRGQLSQGIVFPLAQFPEITGDWEANFATIDALLGIRLWEPPVPASIGDILGPWNLPWLYKTDAERVQNLSDEWLQSVDDGLWIPTEKIDGSSITYALSDSDDRLHVYSRNFELKADNPKTTPIQLAEQYQIMQYLLGNGMTAIQGEMYGSGIQSNRLKMVGHHLAPFAAWERRWSYAHDRFSDLYSPDRGMAGAVPQLELPFPRTVAEALAQADGRTSLINPKCLAEGIVWHHTAGNDYDPGFPELDGRLVFKAVSSTYLIKHGL